MRTLILIPLAAALLAIGSTTSNAATHATKTVGITHTAFVPSSVSVVTGDSVTWTNSDTVNHQVVSQSAGFASPILKPNETFTFTFAKAGKFGYKDALSTKTGTGSVTVANPPVSVTATLAADTSSVVYGVGSVTLHGQLSSKASGQTVTLNEEATGESTAKALTTDQTDATGSYTFTVSPTIETTYSASWRSASAKATSDPVTIHVNPRVGLGRVAHRAHTKWFTYRAKATSDISYAAHYVYFQRYASSIGDWISLKRVYLGSTSAATFRIKLTLPRSQVRVVLPASQAGTGYDSGLSRTVLAVR
jgi:plastocyanin